MTAGIPSIAPATPVSKALKSAEWMAENAYIAPGFHRLLTAGGLTLGLYGGRKVMDVLTARNATTGEDMPAAQTNEFMRPLHGIMRYNPYSDHAVDRWKFVVDKMAPVAVGAVGAYMGGKYFFHGKLPSKEPLFPAGMATTVATAAGKFSTEITDSSMRLFNSDAIRKWAAATFIEGSSTGQHIFGALWPFNNGMIAVAFQEGAQKNNFIPGAKWLNHFLGNHGATSRGMFAAMRETAKWMETNIMREVPIEKWATDEALSTRARDALQKFPSQSAQFEGKLIEAYRGLIHDAKNSIAGFQKATFLETGKEASDGQIREHVYNFISGKTNSKRGLHGQAHDHLLNSLEVDGQRFDLSKTNLAQGPFQTLGHLFGSRSRQIGNLEGHAAYLHDTFKLNVDKEWAKEQLHVPAWKTFAAYGGAGAAIVGGLGAAGAVADKLHSRSKNAHQPHILDQSSLSQHLHPIAYEKPKSDHNLVDWINDKPLGVAHWLSRVMIAPPSMHRFMNAAYLSAVLYVGMKGADVMTGRVLTKINSGKFIEVADKLAEGGKKLVSESVLPIEKVWKPFRPFYKIMDYTPGSAETKDRWRQATHFIIPVAVGMFGTYGGSRMYFNDRIRSLQNVDTLEDYADKITMEQSKFYAGATAVTSIFNTGSGLHLLPVFSYSANMHNRYLLGSGQQVAMPGIGKWWSGNAGTTPWGVKRTLQQLSAYLTYNDGPRPKELRSLVHSLIGKLYPDLTDQEMLDAKQVMIDRIRDVRDSYLVEGVVPASKQAALGEAMNKLFSGTGFEALLRESGLDPAKADLAHNGASGAIANFFGKKTAVAKLTEEYRHKFAERTTTSNTPPPTDFLKSLLDKGPAQSIKLAETNPKPYTERTKGDSSSMPVLSM